MKFVISLLFSISATASPIHLYYENNSSETEVYKEILTKDYQIPEVLISVEKTKECERLKDDGKLDLCLKKNGDLLVVSVDRQFINETLKVFRAP